MGIGAGIWDGLDDGIGKLNLNQKRGHKMAFNWAEAIQIAAEGLVETAALVPTIGSADHQTAANAALQGAGQVAASVITDPTQQAEAVAAFTAAQSILNLVFGFMKKKQVAMTMPPATS